MPSDRFYDVRVQGLAGTFYGFARNVRHDLQPESLLIPSEDSSLTRMPRHR
jgi:hypothetical protein